MRYLNTERMKIR